MRKPVSKSMGSMLRAIKELQGLKQQIVTGAAAATNIAVSGLRMTDVLIGAVNLTDLTNVAIAAVKATWTGAGDYNAVLEVKTAGSHGNGWTVTLVGDSAEAAGVTLDLNVPAKTLVIHYESGVSTVGNINTAIGALTSYEDVIDVKTAGTAATVLTAPGDNVALGVFAGGLDANVNELPTITSDGNIQFAVSTTANKKLLVTYLTAPNA